MKSNVTNWPRIFLITSLLVVWCGLSNSAWTAPVRQPSLTVSKSTTTPLSSTQSIIQRIRERDKVIVAVHYDFEPFGALDETGQLMGFEVDLVQAMADEWGVEVEFVPVASVTAVPKLVAGEVDLVAAALVHTKEGEEQIEFSQTYFSDGQTLLVSAESGIGGIEQLDGATVAAVRGSIFMERIEDYAQANGVTVKVLPFLEYSTALAALKAGQVDALTANRAALSHFARDDAKLLVVGKPLTQDPYALGLPSGDTDFMNLVNFTLQELKEAGMYDEIYEKWFGTEAIPYPIEVLSGQWPYTFAQLAPSQAQPERSQVDELLANRRFVAAVKYDFPPFGFLDDSGELVGFDVDLVREVARRWLADKNRVELVPVSSSNQMAKLVAGEVDLVAAGMTQTKERYESIGFSQSYFVDQQSLLVRTESDIGGLADLDGKTVAAIQGSTSMDNIQTKASQLSITLQILPFLEYSSALEALKAGQVDALTTDNRALLYIAEQNSGLKVVDAPFSAQPYALGIPQHDERFRELVNFTLQEMKQDGSYDAIYCKWFGASPAYEIEIWPGEPIDAKIRERVGADVPLKADRDCLN